MAHADLTQVDSHYEFGRNWQSFSKLIDEDRIEIAVDNLRAILGRESLDGLSFLDIGCGSGLNLVAAARLGATRLVGIDIDPVSIETARAVVDAFAPDAAATLQVASILDTPHLPGAPFDIVYSWGVLHHTGAMWRAMDAAKQLVGDGGILAVALYRKTPWDAVWKLEKRLYSRGPRWVRAPLRAAYKVFFGTGLALRGQRLAAYRDSYQSARGMDWDHDVEDWLGGYPYETTHEAKLRQWAEVHGFRLHALTSEKRLPMAGLFGSACVEYRITVASGQ